MHSQAILLVVVPHLIHSFSIWETIKHRSNLTDTIPRVNFRMVGDFEDIEDIEHTPGMYVKDLIIVENKTIGRHKRSLAGLWYSMTGQSSPIEDSLTEADKVNLPRSRYGQPSLLRASLSPSTTKASLKITHPNTETKGRHSYTIVTPLKSSLQKHIEALTEEDKINLPRSRYGQPSLLRGSLSPSTTSAKLSIKTSNTKGKGRHSYEVEPTSVVSKTATLQDSNTLTEEDKIYLPRSRYGQPSLLRDSLSPSTTKARLSITSSNTHNKGRNSHDIGSFSVTPTKTATLQDSNTLTEEIKSTFQGVDMADRPY